ncbi:MAG TPA: RodZ domain-containing protein [Steroidobacteraceae bacterium]|nr:RodZ domain-containing protein [Steroidobacteraceae bacterium]
MTPPDAEITELPSSPGARLRREREARGLTEQEAAESLNLDPAVITVLEANDFAALGAPVFVKGHLRRYAGLLGLAEDEIVGAYERSKQHVEEPTLVPRSRLEMGPTRGRSRWPWVVGGTAAFLIAAAVLSYLSRDVADESESDGNGVASLPGGSGAPESRGAGSGAGEAPLAGSTTVAGTADAAGAATVAPGADAATASGAPAPAPSTAPAPGPGQVSLQLRFSADSWVEIFDGSGKAVLYDLGKTGSERTITATAPLSVTLGNAPAVAIAVNGRALPPPPTQGSVARFSIGADGTLR